MKYHIKLGDWTTLQPEAQAIRFDVFVREQQVPADIELDEMDPVCLHALAYDAGGQAVGTGRLLPDGHIGRMAVLKVARGTGVGGAILQALMQAAQQRGDRSVVLNAQTRAEGFYGRFGFVRDGDEFDDAGIPHIEMRLKFA
ncbi:GNAT family N-acetyltransferase [Undibacterium arcticum]|uniref:GNAT family N-acetyltransferase n=1 Tax=Undibacterium arcticum TaxID=1762892 RepID=A0ABV7F175_9BURK